MLHKICISTWIMLLSTCHFLYFNKLTLQTWLMPVVNMGQYQDEIILGSEIFSCEKWLLFLCNKIWEIQSMALQLSSEIAGFPREDRKEDNLFSSPLLLSQRTGEHPWLFQVQRSRAGREHKGSSCPEESWALPVKFLPLMETSWCSQGICSSVSPLSR